METKETRALLEFQAFWVQQAVLEPLVSWADLGQWVSLEQREIGEVKDPLEGQDYQAPQVSPMWRAMG